MNLPELKIEGRSGCVLGLGYDEHKIIVRKTSAGNEYNYRIKKQSEKQRDFLSKDYYPKEFSAPLIKNNDNYDENGLFWFEMEYIPGESYINYLQRSTISDLNTFGNLLINFIEKGFSHSNNEVIPKQIIRSKVEEVYKIINREGISTNILDKYMFKIYDQIGELILPVGFCHGDLTLSNMIFSNNKIYLVDFLDSFIESPFIDIVKLRQDTKFYWSLYIDKNKKEFQSGKIIQALRYLDKRIDNHFSKYDFYTKYYDIFETLNLLRILPYLKDPIEIKFIIDCLNYKDN